MVYVKPDVGRRGYLVARLALSEFHARHPDQEIHAYGERLGEVDFPVTWHGRLTPAALNTLYNRTRAGIAMSFTNISLVAEEMLAAGTIPVVNDDADARADLVNPSVEWGAPTPHGIAEALSRAVRRGAQPSAAVEAAAGVRRGWGPAQAGVLAAIEAELQSVIRVQ